MKLCDRFDILSEEGVIKWSVPDYVIDNLNQNFELREYQKEALARFHYYFDGYSGKTTPIQVLFNMATGSGKTLIMAACILYLYERGYRNFIFFVDKVNIIEKTKDNFLNPLSSKYLFNKDRIVFSGNEVDVNQVENFAVINDDDINILFTTIQGLHIGLSNPRENSITYEDFEDKNIILLSDEAHHINTLTKSESRLTQTDKREIHSWEGTVNRIFESNPRNMLLEFTATVPNHPRVQEKYHDKIIFEYDLKQFRLDGFSKDVHVIQSDAKPIDRALQAVILSQYRKKVAERNGIFLKPVILMKSNYVNPPTRRDRPGEYKKVVSEEFENGFHQKIGNLTEKELMQIRALQSDSVISDAFAFFADNNITLDNLVRELKDDFAMEKTLAVNSKSESEDQQLLVNSLEERDNPIRVIFAVDMLNEGWDVLNLFDIVRLYNTRDARSNVPGKTTISEAQLIGRGARYYPFKLEQSQDLYKRKFDEDLNLNARILEELHYHSAQNVRYIQELRMALEDIGILPPKREELALKIKEEIRQSEFWRSGHIFLNKKEKTDRKEINSFSDAVIETDYRVRVFSGDVGESTMFNGKEIREQQIETIHFNLGNMRNSIVRKGLSKNPFYTFKNLQKYLPNLRSITEFITSPNYLAGISVEVNSSKEKLRNLTADDKLEVVTSVLARLRDSIRNNIGDYKGTRIFTKHPVKEILRDKVLKISVDSESDAEYGVPMLNARHSDLRLNLGKENWYVYQENYGTSEEKWFVKFLKKHVNQIQQKFAEIFLVRNAGLFKIYNFSDGRAFEPDFVLFLKALEEDRELHYQIFIEPKGTHLLEKDKWKEELLKKIEMEIGAVDLELDKEYRVMGLQFYNKDNEREFLEEFREVLGLGDAR